VVSGVGRFIANMVSQAGKSKKSPGTWRAGASSQELSPKGGCAATAPNSRGLSMAHTAIMRWVHHYVMAALELDRHRPVPKICRS
jgi:hypothetical protein